MNLIVALILPIQLGAVVATFQPLGVPFRSPVTVAPGLTASVVFSNLTAPRGIAVDSQQNILVVERGFGVTAFSPVSSPSPGWERTVVIQDVGFTQGIQVDGDKLYVSTAAETLLYTYDAATKTVASSPPLVLVTGLPADGELTTHTLQLGQNSILIGSGPKENIDPTARDPSSGRSQVRRFLINPSTPPVDWLSGELIAYGIRNPAGFAFSSGALYVVENGASIDNVTGLTPDFVNDNPADEINKVKLSSLGKFYGFPDCTTLWNPQADPVGDPQYVHLHRGDQISLKLEPERDDTWCQDRSNNEPPVVSFQAHSVPLDIKFYYGPKVASSVTLPQAFVGQAFVSFHGSFDRQPPTGYGVVRVPSVTGHSQAYSFVVQATDISSCPTNCTSIRPVGLVFSKSGELFVTSDSSGELFVIQRSS